MPIYYAVSQVTSHLRDLLDADELLADIWIGGEVANVTRAASGHAYFTLRDDRSQLRCVMFRQRSRGMQHLVSGAAVVVHGRVSIYAQRGEVQLVADVAQPEGVGELQMRLEQLKLKLESEGLFDQSRKRGLPRFPQRIGVVTSPSGAVWHDIQTVVGRRFPIADLVLAPTQVQGAEAAGHIVAAFDALDEAPATDVVILARGGGSLEDLWPFNEEPVARAVYACRAPVISAIGHETDVTVSDMVADVRAATPSAAAELAAPSAVELAGQIAGAVQALHTWASGRAAVGRETARQLEARLGRTRPDVDGLRQRVDDALRAAGAHAKHNAEMEAQRLEGLRSRLTALNPSVILRRGYSIVTAPESGRIVTDYSQLSPGDAVELMFGRGSAEASVTDVHAGGDDATGS